ncbi:hypothetical protein QBC34DRAFT_361296 [Podospora aff. communis PSN243]|uniref:Rhodopsin domain-containing protein n=1 Tax=Podospora aff. communis PSN243 TaxID=3040156 RepID=A0AAV9G732_9PEZI|nr:hypothetical protein QBC34DRAFT_361296 [Podospora aff. communis PSN243]
MDQMDLSQLPPGNAPGLAYNSVQTGTVIAFGITYGLCTFFLALRYVQAVGIVKKMELDLVILTLSYFAALVYFITMVSLMRHGWGRHFDELNITDLLRFNELLLPNTLTYLITPAITKMAILVVLYKINPSFVYRCGVAAVGLAIFAYTLVLTSITGGPCSPLKEGTLTCLMNVALAQAVLNIVSDLAVIALPIPTVISLQLSRKQKINVSCILALGSAVVICSIARLPYVKKMANDPDVTYTEAILGIWSIVEVNLGIMCGSAMRLKPLLVRWFPQLGLFSSEGKSNGVASPFNSWGASKQLRTDPRSASHSYQLHSIQKGSTEPINQDGNIRVRLEYDITSEIDGKRRKFDSDSESNDKIHVPV